MIYGYARISTKKQLGGNSLEEQKHKLLAAGAEIIVTEQYSGKTTDRPLLTELLQKLESGDTLVATKLDRLARSVEEGTRLMRELVQRNIKVNILNIGIIDTSPIGNFLVNTLLAVAELERSMILERMAAGKEIARTRHGYREGRPPLLATTLVTEQGYTLRKAASATGLSATTIWRALQNLPRE